MTQASARRGRPRGFDTDSALEGAMQLFWTRGYEASSMSALLDAMAIGRSSFYQSFGSKHDVFVRSMDRYGGQLLEWLRACLEASPSGLSFFEESFLAVANGAHTPGGRRGCLVFNTAAELGTGDAEVSARVSASIEAFTDLFEEAARRSQREGDMPASLDARLIGRQAVVLMSGLQTLAKAGLPGDELAVLARTAVGNLGGAAAAEAFQAVSATDKSRHGGDRSG